ncbi:MAG: lipopolysaccharide kinase InaA family protein [Myxococcota bacterium]
MSEDGFRRVRARLERLISVPQPNEVYRAKRRSIFVVEDATLGRLAIKEMRHEGAMRRLWFRYPRYRHATREFRVGSAFEALGGQTPNFLGAALERNGFGLERVLLFIRWLDGVETLTDYLARLDPLPSDAFERLADALIAAARLGLVHGRHSSENILVDTSGDQPVFYAIDFAFSRLGRGFDANGFVRDIGRIAHWLWHEQVLDATQMRALFESVARRGWQTVSERTLRISQMNEELRRWQVVLEKG